MTFGTAFYFTSLFPISVLCALSTVAVMGAFFRGIFPRYDSTWMAKYFFLAGLVASYAIGAWGWFQ